MDDFEKTIFTNALKDISDLKDRVKRIESSGPIKKEKKDFSGVDPKRAATEKQIIAVSRMGGQVWDGMTHQDVTNQFADIDRRKAESEQDHNDSFNSEENKLEPGEDKDLFPDY